MKQIDSVYIDFSKAFEDDSMTLYFYLKLNILSVAKIIPYELNEISGT